jgi:hypothetical protein
MKVVESSSIEKSAPIGESSILDPSLSVLSSDPMTGSNRFSESDNFENTAAVKASVIEASQRLVGSVVIAPSPGFDPSEFSGSPDWTSSNALAWSEAYPATLVIRSDNLGDSPGLARSQPLKYSLAFPRSSAITASLPYLDSASFWTRLYDSQRIDLTALMAASAFLPRSSAWTPSGRIWQTGRFADSMKPAESLAAEKSDSLPKSNELDATAAPGGTSGLGGSVGLRKSNWLLLTAAYPPTLQVASRAFNANSESLIASIAWVATGAVNETIGFGPTGRARESERFAYSSPLEKSIAFLGSGELETIDAGALHLSDSNQAFPTGYAAALIIGILAIVLAGACLVVAQTRAQRSTSTDVGAEMGTEMSTDQEDSSVVWEDEEMDGNFVWENPVSDVIDAEFNDRGFSFDIEEGFRQFG